MESTEDRGITHCWCGAVGMPDDLFSSDIDDSCGGSGLLRCYCGGDQCVCHNHGEIECPGCDDCESEFDNEVTPGDGTEE